jgi:protein gp37
MLYEHRDSTNRAEGFRWLQVVSETESIYSVFSVKINPEARRSIWFGMSAEDQQRFNERAEYLTGIRLAENITFVSAEPLLGDIPRF